MNEPILAPVGRCRGRGRKLSTNIEPIGRGRGRPLLFENSVLDISTDSDKARVRNEISYFSSICCPQKLDGEILLS